MTDLTTIEASGLMTPEELALLKQLQDKRKAQMKQMGSIKENLFKSLTESFGMAISKAKKDLVTVSTKVLDDGNIYAITFGAESEEDVDINTEVLAEEIISQHLSDVEPIMGIASSMKVSGTYEGKKLFWQIRKRSA